MAIYIKEENLHLLLLFLVIYMTVSAFIDVGGAIAATAVVLSMESGIPLSAPLGNFKNLKCNLLI
jgi:hypothetical protein